MNQMISLSWSQSRPSMQCIYSCHACAGHSGQDAECAELGRRCGAPCQESGTGLSHVCTRGVHGYLPVERGHDLYTWPCHASLLELCGDRLDANVRRSVLITFQQGPDETLMHSIIQNRHITIQNKDPTIQTMCVAGFSVTILRSTIHTAIHRRQMRRSESLSSETDTQQ